MSNMESLYTSNAGWSRASDKVMVYLNQPRRRPDEEESQHTQTLSVHQTSNDGNRGTGTSYTPLTSQNLHRLGFRRGSVASRHVRLCNTEYILSNLQRSLIQASGDHDTLNDLDWQRATVQRREEFITDHGRKTTSECYQKRKTSSGEARRQVKHEVCSDVTSTGQAMECLSTERNTEYSASVCQEQVSDIPLKDGEVAEGLSAEMVDLHGIGAQFCSQAYQQYDSLVCTPTESIIEELFI